MRNELLVFSAFLFVVVALANDKPEKYEIELKEKIKYLKRCVGKTGQLEHIERYDIFFINVKKQLCLDMLRNSAQHYLFNEAPTHFDIYIPARNNVTFKCNANFTLTEESERVTKLEAVCVKPS